jgi:hypothetical protein
LPARPCPRCLPPMEGLLATPFLFWASSRAPGFHKGTSLAQRRGMRVGAQDRSVTARYATAKLIIRAKDMVSVCITAERAAHGERSSLHRSMVNPGGAVQTLRNVGFAHPRPRHAHIFFSHTNILAGILE